MKAHPADPTLRDIHLLVRGGAAGGLTDGELLDRFVARGDEAAFEVLVAPARADGPGRLPADARMTATTPRTPSRPRSSSWRGAPRDRPAGAGRALAARSRPPRGDAGQRREGPSTAPGDRSRPTLPSGRRSRGPTATTCSRSSTANSAGSRRNTARRSCSATSRASRTRRRRGSSASARARSRAASRAAGPCWPRGWPGTARALGRLARIASDERGVGARAGALAASTVGVACGTVPAQPAVAVSAGVAALTRGTLRTMLMTKLRAASVALAIGGSARRRHRRGRGR